MTYLVGISFGDSPHKLTTGTRHFEQAPRVVRLPTVSCFASTGAIRAASWIGSRSTPSLCRPWRKRLLLCRCIPGMAPASARNRESWPAALRPHCGGSAPWHVQAAQPRDRPCLPGPGPDRPVGQRHPADDGRLSRRGTVDADRTSEALGAFSS